MKREWMIIPVLLVSISFLSGCSLSSTILLPTDFQKDIYNKNDRIISDDNYTFVKRIGYDEGDYRGIEFQGFYGSNTFEDLNIEGNSIVSIDFDSQIHEGMFKIVLITPEQEVIDISENTEKGNFKIIAPQGNYIIKIIGNSASGKVMIKTSKSNFLSG